MSILIETQRLKKVCNPFAESPWGIGTISRKMVMEALMERRFNRFPFSSFIGDELKYDHAGRVAFLIENPSNDPIDLDVGMPSFGLNVEWMVIDGNHRLAAAIIAKREKIPVEFSG